MHSNNQNLPGTKQLIYVVDDLGAVAELVVNVLTRAGYKAEMFLDPWTAFMAFESANPKPVLLISDFQMPGMNGMELIEKCNALSPSLKTTSFSGTLFFDADLQRYAVKPDISF